MKRKKKEQKQLQKVEHLQKEHLQQMLQNRE
jgi:hypothetical protein